MTVAVGVAVAVSVGSGVKVAVGVGEGIGVGVSVGRGVAVAVAVGGGVDVGSAVEVAVGVAGWSTPQPARENITTPTSTDAKIVRDESFIYQIPFLFFRVWR